MTCLQEERDTMKQKKDGLNVRGPSKNVPGKSINDDDEKTKLIQKEGIESVTINFYYDMSHVYSMA